jgi:hypothetical protein
MLNIARACAASAAALLALSLALPGCGGSDCEKAVDNMLKCVKSEKDSKVSKSDLVGMCEKAKAENKEDFEEGMVCAKETDCDKMKACEQAQRGKRRAKKITESIAAQKWGKAFDDCTLIEDYFSDETYKAECNKVFANADKITGEGLSSIMFRCQSGEKLKKVAPEFEKACKTIATGQLAAAQKAATEARDAGKNDYKVCSDLKKVAELAGGDAVAAAGKLCDEMAAAEPAKKAADEARANAGAKKTSMPFQCDMAAEKLAKLDTEWAKKTFDDMLKACYVELGAVVIEEKGKDAKYVCPFEIKKLTEAAGKYDLVTKFPELAESMKKLPPKCKVEEKKDAKDAKK